MGDIPMGCAIWRWMSLPIERPQHAALKNWFDGLCQRPGYQKVVMKPLT
jgi:glutathione S-transferase